MTQQIDQLNQIKSEIVEVCYYRNAAQIAELEFSLRGYAMIALAALVREQGIINAGDDYIIEYEALKKRVKNA